MALSCAQIEERYLSSLQAEKTRLIENELGDHRTIKVILGERLVQKETKASELVKSWMRGGTGSISLMQFRQQVRKWVEHTNVREIDALFAELDADGDGALDVDELKAAMQRLLRDAKAADTAKEAARARVAVLDERMGSVNKALDLTRAAETADAELARVRDNPILNARLGHLLMIRRIKIADVVATWEATKGEVNAAQFRRNVRTLGLDATDGDIDDLFSSLDSDDGGTLDLEELRLALSQLQEAGVAAEKEMARLTKACGELWRTAKAAQSELKHQRKVDEAADQQMREAAAEEARMRAKAEEETRLKKVEAAAEAKKRKLEQKAAFEAKIKERRASLVSHVTVGLGPVHVATGS